MLFVSSLRLGFHFRWNQIFESFDPYANYIPLALKNGQMADISSFGDLMGLDKTLVDTSPWEGYFVRVSFSSHSATAAGGGRIHP